MDKLKHLGAILAIRVPCDDDCQWRRRGRKQRGTADSHTKKREIRARVSWSSGSKESPRVNLARSRGKKYQTRSGMHKFFDLSEHKSEFELWQTALCT